MLKENFIKSAKEYLNLGFSVIPVKRDKKPFIEWKEYQTRKPTLEEIEEWGKYDDPDLGIVTGKISGLVVIDVEKGGGVSDLPGSVIVRTGGGGFHYYFKYPQGIEVGNKTRVRELTDIRGEGGFVVAPPSGHKSGGVYSWVQKIGDREMADLPEWVTSDKPGINLIVKTSFEDYVKIPQGQRNDAMTRFVGKTLNSLEMEQWETDGWKKVVEHNNKYCEPPLGEVELKTIFTSIAKKEASKPKEESQRGKRSVANRIVDLVIELGAECFLDQTNEPHIVIPERPLIGYPTRGSVFRRWIAGRYWNEYGKGFSGSTLDQAINSIEGKSFHEGIKRTLYNRVAKLGKNIYYDLGDDSQIIEITTGGWKITTESPVKFKRFSHQLPQVLPNKGGDVMAVMKYLNLKTEGDKLLFLTYLLTIFIPNIPRVVLVNIGDQGAAKSTALRVIRSLVDPSVADLLSPPGDINELALASNHHYCLYLDNLSYLKDEMSDAICRLATGIGFTKRKLFTDDEDIVFSQKVAVGITGINLVAEKADLLDRCLILNFERIPDSKRMEESDFWDRFNKDKPLILGSICDKLSAILGQSDGFKLPNKPRMADYAKYAALAAKSLGTDVSVFMNVYGENIGRQNQAAIEASVTAQVLLKYMENKESWTGLSSELHKELKLLVDKTALQVGGSEGFPKSSNWLWKRIMQIRPNLMSLGIYPTKTEKTTGSYVCLSRVDVNAAITATGSQSQIGSMAVMAANGPTTDNNNLSLIPGLEDVEEGA